MHLLAVADEDVLLHVDYIAHVQATHLTGSSSRCAHTAQLLMTYVSKHCNQQGGGLCSSQVADGTVHPLTAYSLSFLKRLFTYESSITVLFADPEATPGLART